MLPTAQNNLCKKMTRAAQYVIRHGTIIDSRHSILSTQTLSSTQHKGTKRNESSSCAYCNEIYHVMSSTLTAMTSTPTGARSDPERRPRRRDCSYLGARRPRGTRPPTPPTPPQTRTRTTQTTKIPIQEYHATQWCRQRHHSPLEHPSRRIESLARAQ